MKLIILILILFSSGCATRLVTLNNSNHYNNNKYNESHHGVGFDVNVKNDWWIGILKYQNSFNNTSRMITFTQEWRINDKWYWGAKMGFSDGYDHITPLAAIGGVTLRYNFLGSLGIYVFITPILTADGLTIDIFD